MAYQSIGITGPPHNPGVGSTGCSSLSVNNIDLNNSAGRTQHFY